MPTITSIADESQDQGDTWSVVGTLRWVLTQTDPPEDAREALTACINFLESGVPVPAAQAPQNHRGEAGVDTPAMWWLHLTSAGLKLLVDLDTTLLRQYPGSTLRRWEDFGTWDAVQRLWGSRGYRSAHAKELARTIVSAAQNPDFSGGVGNDLTATQWVDLRDLCNMDTEPVRTTDSGYIDIPTRE